MEQLFNRWLNMKHDIQQLAGIVQNDVELTEDDLAYWLSEVDRFKVNFNELRLETIRLVRLKK